MNETNSNAGSKHEELVRAQEAKRKALKDEIDNLRDRLERQTGALQGDGFEIVETSDGPIGLVPHEMVLYKRFIAALQEKKTAHEDFYDFVAPCVEYPEKTKVDTIFEKRPAYVNRCANALIVLYGGKGDDERGKY